MRRYAALLLLLGCGGERAVEWSLPDDAFWPDPRQYPGVGDGRILVTNNLSDTISILDYGRIAAGELVEIGRIPVGLNPVEREGPHHLTVEPSGEHYYVGISNFVPASGSGPHGTHGSGTADGHVLAIRTADNVQSGTVRVDRNPGDLRMTPDGKWILVSHFDVLRITEALRDGTDPASNLVFIDPASMSRAATVKLCPAAHGIGIAPDSTRAYVSCFDDHLAVVDLVAPEHPVTLVPVLPSPGSVQNPICEPYAMTVAPAGDSVWVSCFGDGRVLRFDTARGVMDGAVASGGRRAVFGAFSRDGATLYLPHQDPDGIAVIDVATRMVTAQIAVAGSCLNAHVVYLTDDERSLLAVCEGDHSSPGTLILVDVAARTLRQSIELGVYPDDVQVVR